MNSKKKKKKNLKIAPIRHNVTKDPLMSSKEVEDSSLNEACTSQNHFQ